jgi:hypothetical protein
MKQISKSKQIGVRFRLDLLEAMKEDELATTPQQVLNYLTQFYCENKHGKKELREDFANSKLFSKENKAVLAPIIKNEGKHTGKPIIVKPNDTELVQVKVLPDRLPGESSIEYRIRCMEGGGVTISLRES